MREETLVANLIRYKDTLEGMLTAMVGDPCAAEDLFQEVALIATRKREELLEEGPFFSWARAVALNVARDHRKRTRRRRVELLDDRALEAIAEVFREPESRGWDWRREALKGCVGALPERQREVLRLKYEGNLSVDDLATSLSMNRGAVDTLLYRIRQALSRCVRGRLHELGAP